MRTVDFVGCVLGYLLVTTLIWALVEAKPPPSAAAAAMHTAPPMPSASATQRHSDTPQ